jgi:hypothetical protein
MQTAGIAAMAESKMTDSRKHELAAENREPHRMLRLPAGAISRRQAARVLLGACESAIVNRVWSRGMTSSN